MPALADLPLGAGDLLAVVVDVEVVAGEAFTPTVLPGGVAPERPGDGDLVVMCGLCKVGQGGVAAVDQVLGGQQPRRCRRASMPGRTLLSWVVEAVVATSVITLGSSGAHVFVRRAENPFQLTMCP